MTRGLCRALWWQSQGYSLPHTENFACLQYQTYTWQTCTRNTQHCCNTNSCGKHVEEHRQIKIYGFPCLLHLINVQPSFSIDALLHPWRIRLIVWLEILNTAVCFWVEHLWVCSINAWTCTFSCFMTFQGWQFGFLC